MDLIKSRKNPKIRFLKELKKADFRRETGYFLIEGRRELGRAIQNNVSLEHLYLAESAQNFRENLGKDIPYTVIADDIFEVISLRQNPDGICATAQQPDCSLPAKLPPNALVVVVDSLEKPGNIGAILRSMDATRANLLIVTNPICDIWNGNVVRASQGAIFACPIALCSQEEAYQFLREQAVRIVSTGPRATRSFWDAAYLTGTAFVFGNENQGLGNFWFQSSDETVRIPMYGHTSDSLNVNVTASLCLYEFRRQQPPIADMN